MQQNLECMQYLWGNCMLNGRLRVLRRKLAGIYFAIVLKANLPMHSTKRPLVRIYFQTKPFLHIPDITVLHVRASVDERIFSGKEEDNLSPDYVLCGRDNIVWMSTGIPCKNIFGNSNAHYF